MRRFSILTIAFTIWLPAAVFSAVEGPGTVYLQPGFFCARETVDTAEAEDTISGVVNLVDGLPDLLGHGTIVPAQIGVGFGMLVEVRPELAGPIRMEVRHPPMGPNGVEVESWMTTYEAGTISYNGFTFEYDYELKPGPWSFTATSNGRLVYHVDFTVIDPRIGPKISCAGGLLS